MSQPSISYVLANGTANDAGEVNTNFSDIISALTDGTKDLTMATGTFTTLIGTTATFTSITATNLLSTLLPTNATYDLGDATHNFKALFLDNGATHGGRVNFNAGATSYVGADATGLILQIAGFTSAVCPAGVSNSISEARTRTIGASVGLGGVAISSSSGTFTRNNTAYEDVTNLSVTITTSGRPVKLQLQDTATGLTIGSSAQSGVRFLASGDNALCYVRFLSNGNAIRESILFTDESSGITYTETVLPASILSHVDNTVAGTYTYKIQVCTTAGTTIVLTDVLLVAYEL